MTWLRKHALVRSVINWILIPAISAAYVILIGDRYGFETAISWAALLIASFSLLLLVFQIRLTHRPFISFGEILGDAIPLLNDKLSLFIIRTISIPVFNSGPIPASKLNIHISLKCGDCPPPSSSLSEYIPALSPNAHNCVLNLSISNDASTQQCIRDGNAILELLIIYEGHFLINTKPYKTRQTYRIERSAVPLSNPNQAPLVFRPIDPTEFT